MIVDEAAVVSCYSDTAAFLVMLLLMLMSVTQNRKKDPSMRIFHGLCLTHAVTCALRFLCHAMARQTPPWCHALAVASRTLCELNVFLLVYLWSAYVEKKLMGDRHVHTLVKALYGLPFIVFTALLIVNLFTGVLFVCTGENLFEYRRLYHVFTGVQALYFAVALARIRHYKRRAAKVCFIRVMPLLVPTALGSAVQFFLPFQTAVLGISIGALLMYIFMSDEADCLDAESGLYNLKFLSYLCDLAAADRTNPRSALTLDVSGDLKAGFGLLRGALHQDNDVVRTDAGRFVMFSGESSRSALQYYTSLVDEAVVRHNAEHPKEAVRITVRSRIRTGEEDAVEFIRSVRYDKGTSDEMRGVLSMISEMDRLDEELKMAADIQVNMLPSNFPPFPDRTEFDLYASMTPAKEVGGDFYDFFLIDEDHLALVIADVSGKGIPAALFMTVSKALIKNQLMSGCDPASALTNVNQQLCERNSSMMFVTVWAAVIEISTGRGLACNAGHEDPGLRRAGGPFGLLEYRHNMFIGVSKKAKYDNREFLLEPDDCVFVYTDGVTEAEGAQGGMFGEERLADVLNRDPGADPEALIRRMKDALNDFSAGAPQFDDITMLSLKYKGSRRGNLSPSETNP